MPSPKQRLLAAWNNNRFTSFRCSGNTNVPAVGKYGEVSKFRFVFRPPGVVLRFWDRSSSKERPPKGSRTHYHGYWGPFSKKVQQFMKNVHLRTNMWYTSGRTALYRSVQANVYQIGWISGTFLVLAAYFEEVLWENFQHCVYRTSFPRTFRKNNSHELKMPLDRK